MDFDHVGCQALTSAWFRVRLVHSLAGVAGTWAAGYLALLSGLTVTHWSSGLASCQPGAFRLGPSFSFVVTVLRPRYTDDLL